MSRTWILIVEDEGTGIELAIALRAAQKIGGTLWVESAVVGGSMLFVNLPKSILAFK